MESPRESPDVPMISMKEVNKHFGDLHVLQNINLEVGKGQVVVVLGPSGSGKSTLCRTINRLETIDSLKPAVIRSVGDDGFLYLLMPVRVS